MSGFIADGRALLTALQLADSSLPTGSFSLSHGLETASSLGVVGDVRGLCCWLRVTLRSQVGPSDAVAARWAASDGGRSADLPSIDARLHATKTTREPREASLRCGRALASQCSEMFGQSLDDVDWTTGGPHASVALGALCGRLGLGPSHMPLVVLHGYLGASLGAAVRLGIVDHVQAQRIRFELTQDIAASAAMANHIHWRDQFACAPRTEIMSMMHETSTTRMFAT
jgi:urease accessory protein